MASVRTALAPFNQQPGTAYRAARRLKGGNNPLAPSSNQFENLPTARHDTAAPVVILKPVLALVARMPSCTV